MNFTKQLYWSPQELKIILRDEFNFYQNNFQANLINYLLRQCATYICCIVLMFSSCKTFIFLSISGFTSSQTISRVFALPQIDSATQRYSQAL